LTNASIKKDLVLQSFFLLIPGLLLFTSFLKTESMSIPPLLVSLAVMSFIFSAVSTVTQSSFIVLQGVFEPLKVLPIHHGTVYVSGLLSISIAPIILIALPGLIFVGYKYPLSGILGVIWIFAGIFAGHTCGLFIFSVFGLKIKHKTGKKSIFRMFTNILALFVYIGSFLVIMRIGTTETFASFILKYMYVYPFSVTTVFEPVKSVIILAGHIIVMGIIYMGLLKKLWNNIVEPHYISEPGITPFQPSSGNDITALTGKDFKILFKQPAMLVGFLAPVTSVVVLFFLIPEEGLIEPGTVIPLFLVSVISAATSSVSLTIEGTFIDFLRMLPLTKRRFALSKSVTIMIFPLVFSFLYVVFFGLHNREVLYFIPYAFAFPVTSSLFSMIFYFRYRSDALGIPKSSWGKVGILTCAVVLLLGLSFLPVIFIGGGFGYSVSYVLSGGIVLLLSWWFLRT
jgi:predicted permease